MNYIDVNHLVRLYDGGGGINGGKKTGGGDSIGATGDGGSGNEKNIFLILEPRKGRSALVEVEETGIPFKAMTTPSQCGILTYTPSLNQ